MKLPELTIVGYSNGLSFAPGETVRFMVSEEGTRPDYQASLLRMHSFDDDPTACGLIEEPVSAAFEGRYSARHQDIETGSHVTFDADHAIAGLRAFTAQAYIWPTTPGRGWQTVISCWDAASGQGFALGLDENGAAALRLALPGQSEVVISTGLALREREWVLIHASYDDVTGEVVVGQLPRLRFPLVDTQAVVRHLVAKEVPAWPPLPLAITARQSRMQRFDEHFNGKIDRPRLCSRALSHPAVKALAGATIPDEVAASVLGFWDFARDMTSVRVIDLSPWARHGCLVNLPTRGMTGFNWTGDEQDWRRAPEQYGAIHFHDDDLYDAKWEADFTWDIPPQFPSGCYAVKLEDGNVPGYIVLFIRPPRHAVGGNRPRIAFLAPTAHYLAYANYRLADRPGVSEAFRGRLWQLGPEDLLMHQRPAFGSSTYDMHSDGSGVCYTSYLRPILNLRPNTRLASLAGDGYVLALLRHADLPYDVITDEDLHEDGLSLLAPYSCVITGGHPEYWSLAMLHGMEGYLQRGGRLMYLGGNGFYWRIAFHRELKGAMEVRRSEDGTRPWAAEPGEYYMSFTGEYGGIWRRIGHVPNRMLGVGFTAQGMDVATYYRRQPAASDPRAAFIFAGVQDEIIGDFGAGFYGAAGQEIDRFDLSLGSPPHALVLASSENHTDNMLLANEEFCSTHLAVGGTESPLVRADMVFFETGHGGAVFSTGSISWVAALACEGFDNNVAKITINVIRRFIDPAEFPRIDDKPDQH
jgi:N,N-dimethylformamidase